MARLFNGTSDVITATMAAVDSGDWTMGCWFKTNANTNYYGLFAIATGADARIQEIFIEIPATTGESTFRANQYAATTNADTIPATGNAISNGVWYCFVATFRASDGKIRIYKGTLTASMAEPTYFRQTVLAGARTTGGTAVNLGRFNATTALYFNGALAYPFFAKKEWTLAESEVYRHGRIPITSLQNMWMLTNPDVTINFDQIGGANGTNTGVTVNPDPIPFFLPSGLNNYQFVSAGDGMSVSEKIR